MGPRSLDTARRAAESCCDGRRTCGRERARVLQPEVHTESGETEFQLGHVQITQRVRYGFQVCPSQRVGRLRHGAGLEDGSL